MIAEFPLFIFTLFAGVSAGTYALAAAFPLKQKEERAWIFPLIMLILLGIGLIGCMAHLHHPERFLNALWNPLAGITQEAYLSMLFGLMLVIDPIFSMTTGATPRVVRIIGAVFGVILTFVMGFAYFNTLGVEPWGTYGTVPLFVMGDLAMGCAVWPLFNKDAYGDKSYLYTTVIIAALLICDFLGLTIAFSGFGINPAAFIAAAIIGPIAQIFLTCLKQCRSASWMPIVVCACIIVGAAIARYAFYAVA